MFISLTENLCRHATETKETKISNKRNTVKNLNWQEAHQLDRVTKRERGFEVGTTEKQKNPAGGTVEAENPETTTPAP